jgi:hypothetical protein
VLGSLSVVTRDGKRWSRTTRPSVIERYLGMIRSAQRNDAEVGTILRSSLRSKWEALSNILVISYWQTFYVIYLGLAAQIIR